MWGISSRAEHQLVSQEDIYTVELGNQSTELFSEVYSDRVVYGTLSLRSLKSGVHG